MTILCPADALETKLATKLAMEIDGPVYLRTVRCPLPVIFDKSHTLELGIGKILHEGNEVAIISTGMMTHKALIAVEGLEKKGINCRLIHMATIKPLDEEIIIEAAKDCKTIITIENHSVKGGLGGAVSEVVTKHHPCKVISLGFPDIFMESGDNEKIFSKLKINVEDIKDIIIDQIKK
jgi:transketolase